MNRDTERIRELEGKIVAAGLSDRPNLGYRMSHRGPDAPDHKSLLEYELVMEKPTGEGVARGRPENVSLKEASGEKTNMG